MELGRLIRKVFVPEEGFVFLDADYSQIELRVLAHMSGDEKLIQAYREAEDIHRLTASQVFHVPLDEVTPLQRRNAKAVNFGIVYGISSFGLSQDLSITRKEAAAYIEKYFETYPKIKGFLDGLVKEGREHGYVTTMFGRRRPVPELKSSNFMQRSFGERVAMNSPIQGTAADIIKIAIHSMGLEDLKPFNPREKVIEYLLEDEDKTAKLVDLTVSEFANETSRESPAPGGGTIAAYMGALGAALGTMVANLSAHKRGWDERWEEFSQWADRGQDIVRRALHLVDEDTEAFNRIMDAFGLPKGTEEEKAARSQAIQDATLYATKVPLETMKTAYAAFDICRAMAQEGNPASVSDAGVGALAARSAVLGAWLNVRINAASLKDRATADAILAEAKEMAENAQQQEKEILAIVDTKIEG